MKYKYFVRLYSNSRIIKYYKVTGGDKNKTMLLYFANLKIAQAFHPLLGSMEVILRNQLHYTLAKHFNDSSWIINQRSGFMVASSLTYHNKKTSKLKTNNFLLHEVSGAIDKLKNKGVNVTPGRVIAEQNLSFWNSLYENHHYAILKGIPGTIFKNLPSGYGRKDINATLTDIRQLRNRINHNEPICFVNKKRDFTYVRDMHHKIIDLLSWIDPDIISSLSNIDNVIKVINKEEQKQLQ